MRRLLGRSWMVAQAAGRDAIEAGDITAAADESVTVFDGRATGRDCGPPRRKRGGRLPGGPRGERACF